MNAIVADVHEHFKKPEPYITSVEVDPVFGTKIINVNWMQYEYLEDKIDEYKGKIPRNEFRIGVKYMNDKLRQAVSELMADKNFIANMMNSLTQQTAEQDAIEEENFKQEIIKEIKSIIPQRKGFFHIKSLSDIFGIIAGIISIVVLVGGIWMFNDLKYNAIQKSVVKDIVIELPSEYMPQEVSNIILENLNGK